MFIVLLRFTDNRGQASQLGAGHNAWIERGFDEGVFLLLGSLQPDLGGGILAHNTSLAELRRRIDDDPFVANGVVRAEVLEIAPGRTDDRLQFLGG